MTSVKHIIGLTGNIATGKSVVRRMLVNHGALGIDADVIAHRVLYKGGTAFQPVVESFGEQILNPFGEIDRKKLAEIVFSSPDHLKQLEELTHPAVTNAIQQRIDAADLPVVVIEAIKLMESSLVNLYETLWVSHVSEAEQLARLIEIRKHSFEDARHRISAQPPQSEKLSAADVVIHTTGTFENTWQQIRTALNDTIHSSQAFETPHINIVHNWWIQPFGSLPESQLAAFLERNPRQPLEGLYELLAFKVVTPVMNGQGIDQLLIWDCNSFTGKFEQLIPGKPSPTQAEAALLAFETHARINQCELLIVPATIAGVLNNPLAQNGFRPSTPNEISYPDWQQALSNQQGSWIKILNQPFESTDKTFFD